jgi:dephospho-CoA kinase
MKEIGITGGIGSGKSTICKVLSSLNIPIYYADERAKKIYEIDPEVKKLVKESFDEVFNENGEIVLKKLGEIVFADPIKLKLLESIVHPAVKKDYINWRNRMKNENFSIIAKEAALMFESGSYKELDYVITISAPLALRWERVKKRSNINEQDFNGRIANQWSDEKRRNLANFEIINDEKHPIIPQIADIIEKLSTLNKYS